MTRADIAGPAGQPLDPAGHAEQPLDPVGPAEQPLDPAGRTVLSAQDIARCLRRIAHEVLEHNRGPGDLVLVGLAALISEVEGAVIPVGALDITMYRDDLRHQPTRPPMMTVIPPGGIEGKVVVLVDDVLYSGRTVRAALDALSEYGRPKAVRLAVLVDRGHRELPIRADHVGKNLPTSHAEKVQVRLAANDGVEDIVRIAGGEAR